MLHLCLLPGGAVQVLCRVFGAADVGDGECARLLLAGRGPKS